jgi:hypothetical protein
MPIESACCFVLCAVKKNRLWVVLPHANGWALLFLVWRRRCGCFVGPLQLQFVATCKLRAIGVAAPGECGASSQPMHFLDGETLQLQKKKAALPA